MSEIKAAVEKLLAQIKRDTRVSADRAGLVETLNQIGLAYDGAQYWKGDDERFPHSLAKLEPAAKRVLAVLLVHENQRRLCSDQAARNRLQRLTRELEAVRQRAQTVLAAGRKPRGHPQPLELHDLVHSLADYWEGELGLKFTQLWHTESDRRGQKKRRPVSAAARFVYAVVHFIDAKRIGELPTVTKVVVQQRRRERVAGRG